MDGFDYNCNSIVPKCLTCFRLSITDQLWLTVIMVSSSVSICDRLGNDDSSCFSTSKNYKLIWLSWIIYNSPSNFDCDDVLANESSRATFLEVFTFNRWFLHWDRNCLVLLGSVSISALSISANFGSAQNYNFDKFVVKCKCIIYFKWIIPAFSISFNMPLLNTGILSAPWNSLAICWKERLKLKMIDL